MGSSRLESGAGARGARGSRLGPARALCVFAVAAAVFLPTLRHGFLTWDDADNLTNNTAFRGFTTEHLRWMFTTRHGGHYMPLTWLSFALDHALWGMAPRGFHLTNVLLHGLAATLFAALLARLLTAAGGAALAAPGRARWCAVGGALLFALHPLRVESVAWATERRDLLSGVFWLGTLLAYLWALAASGRARKLRLALAALLFVLSLLAKAWGVTLPVVLLVLDAYPLRRFGRERLRALLLEKLVFAVPALAVAAQAFLAQESSGAVVSLVKLSVPGRVVQALFGLGFYPGKTLAPLGLSPLYPLLRDPYPPGGRELAYVAFGLALAAAAFALRRRFPAGLAAWATFALVISPVLGFVQSGPQIAADRYTYLACLPFAALGAAGLLRLTERAGARAALIAGALLLALLGGLTWRQTGVWRDTHSLWTRALAVDPTNRIARAYLHLQLGFEREGAGDLAGARADYDVVVASAPQLPDGFYNRANVRVRAGDAPGALLDYGEALRLRPGYALALVNRGLTRSLMGDDAGAVLDLDAAVRADPREYRAFANRAPLRRDAGDLHGALADYDAALALEPGEPTVLWGRARVRRALGDSAGAAADARAVIARLPPGAPLRARVAEFLQNL